MCYFNFISTTFKSFIIYFYNPELPMLRGRAKQTYAMSSAKSLCRCAISLARAKVCRSWLLISTNGCKAQVIPYLAFRLTRFKKNNMKNDNHESSQAKGGSIEFCRPSLGVDSSNSFRLNLKMFRSWGALSKF